MTLTEKAKEKFEMWLLTSDIRDKFNLTVGTSITGFVYSLPQPCLNALIVEFFDINEIYIDVNVVSIDGLFDATIFHHKYRQKDGKTISEIPTQDTRQEATTEAIKKANEIINEL